MTKPNHRHCPVCGDVMETIGGNGTFNIHFCRKYPCRALSVDFSTDNKTVVNKKIFLFNAYDIDERETKERDEPIL